MGGRRLPPIGSAGAAAQDGAAGATIAARCVALTLAVALTALLLPGWTAEAAAPQRISRWSPAPGIVHETYRWQLPRGPVEIDVVRYDRTDRRVTMTPELSRGRVAGLETTSGALRRLGDEAIAGVNANFFFCAPGPCGDPQGLFVRHRDFISQPEAKSWARGWLGGFVTYSDGSYAVGRPQFEGQLTQPDGVRVPIAGVNRHPVRPTSTAPRLTEVTVLTRAMGSTTGTPPGTTELTLRGPRADWQVSGSWQVIRVSTAGNAWVPSDGVVVAASGDLGRRFANGIHAGETVGLRLSSTAGWRLAQHGVSAGPLLIAAGRLIGEADWNTEGFGDGHNRTAHPRTAVGFRADGQNLLVTADGRLPGYSVGLTTAETRELLRLLGADDALMLDGGGSTTMSIEGALVNRPSDPGGARSVASHLVVWSRGALPPVSTSHACPADRVRTASFVDTAGNVHRSSIDCVAWWEVANGTSRATYSPDRRVSRAQMATFIVNAIEAAGGSLPATGPQFTDVRPGSTHDRAIRRLAAAGIVDGYRDGRYRPGAAVTRAQMATFLVRAYDRLSGGQLRSAERYFRDTDRSAHRSSIMAAAEAGLTSGVRPRRYAPSRSVRRDQMASFIARMLDRAVREVGALTPDRRATTSAETTGDDPQAEPTEPSDASPTAPASPSSTDEPPPTPGPADATATPSPDRSAQPDP